jgi:hypothetical protein
MTETEALKESAQIMYITLNGVYQLHDITQLEPEDGDKAIDACAHCSELADAIVHYPCPTVQVLLAQMVEEELTSPDEEETSESTQPE